MKWKISFYTKYKEIKKEMKNLFGVYVFYKKYIVIILQEYLVINFLH